MAPTKRLRKYYYRNKQTKQTKQTRQTRQTRQKRTNKPRKAKTRKSRGGALLSSLTKMMPSMPKSMPSMPKVMPSMSTLSSMPMKGLSTLSTSVSSALYGKNRPPKTEILEIIRVVRDFNNYVLQNDLGDEFIKYKEEINFKMEYKKMNAIFEKQFEILDREDIEKISLAVILMNYMEIYEKIISYKKKIADIIEPVIDDKLSVNKDLISQPIILNYYKKLAEKPNTEEESKIQKSNHNCFYQIYYIYMPEIDKFISKIEHLTSKTLIANEFYIGDNKMLDNILFLNPEAFRLVYNYTQRYDKTIPDSKKKLLAKEICIQQYEEDLDTQNCQNSIQQIIATIEIDTDNRQLFENLDIAISLLNVGDKPCVVVSELRSSNYYLIQKQAQTFIDTIPKQKKQITSDKTLTSEIQQQKITSLDKLYNQISIIMNIAYLNMPQEARLKYEEVQEEEQAQHEKIMTLLADMHKSIAPTIDAYYENISELKEYERKKYIYGPLMNNISYMRYIMHPLKEFSGSAEFAIVTKKLGFCNIHRRHRLYTSLLNGAERFETYIKGEVLNGEKLSPAMDNILTITSHIKTVSKIGLDNEIIIKPGSESGSESNQEPGSESGSDSESKDKDKDPTGGKYLHRIMRKKYTKKRQIRRRKM